VWTICVIFILSSSPPFLIVPVRGCYPTFSSLLPSLSPPCCCSCIFLTQNILQYIASFYVGFLHLLLNSVHDTTKFISETTDDNSSVSLLENEKYFQIFVPNDGHGHAHQVEALCLKVHVVYKSALNYSTHS